MKGLIVLAIVASSFAVPQSAEAFGGLFARRAVVNAQIARNRQLNRVLAAQVRVNRNAAFVAPIVVQRNVVPLQQPFIVNGFSGGFHSGFIAPQPIVVQQRVGGCSAFFR